MRLIFIKSYVHGQIAPIVLTVHNLFKARDQIVSSPLKSDG